MARLVGFYLQYIKRYTYIIIITYKGINVIIIVWFYYSGSSIISINLMCFTPTTLYPFHIFYILLQLRIPLHQLYDLGL